MTGTTRAPRRHYGGRSDAERRAERHERLMEAGLELFGSEGYAGTSIERLCATASVSTRNFYEEFPSREALLVALHDRITQRAMQNALTALTGFEDEPLAERVGRMVRAYITTTSSDPKWTRLAYVEVVGVSAAVEEHRLMWRERIVKFLVDEANRAVERGEAAPRNFLLTSVAFIGAVNELVYYWSMHDRTPPLDDLCAELTRLAVAAITASS
ncbi:AcrR family transcriptional regulator [Kibdelosporangium banguiense]|uniref:AcrR family transcriptional regulator n=1 Tax=Kibdelosporangium banguiense TaxID=1365924 RepID=A0ABS4TH18_9PSEU|nr:TetR/AcrR family transcriptional regulator [Kibdelosporangium banguiense]MBP2323722.1 AcrR family transcriptional regulator [Kibdelosporangium banguiense]